MLPLTAERKLVGCLSLEWAEARDFDPELRDSLLAVAELCAQPVVALLRLHDEPLPELEAEPARTRWFRGIVDELPAPVLLLDPRFEEQDLRDLHITFANRAAGDTFRADASLLEVHPEVASENLLRIAHEVLHSGQAQRDVPLELAREDGAVEVSHSALVRVGSVLLLTWQEE